MPGAVPLRPSLALAAALALAAVTTIVSAAAETRVTYKSAKTASSYYQMAVQLAEAIKAGTDGDVILTIEESQGSVQNVKEAAKRTGNYVFTTPPGLIKLATGGKKMFEGDDVAAYETVRSLFPIPYLTMHFVVRADAGIDGFDGLAGHKFLIGKGSFGAREAERYLELFGVAGAVDLVDVELNAAVLALQNHQIDGFATAGSYPAPNVLEAGASVSIDLIGLSDEEIEKTGRDRLVIPAGTYPGVDEPVSTTTLPVGAYTMATMDEETAYTLTKTFWERRTRMGETNPWWNGVTADGLSTLGAPLHPGAARYYKEAGIAIPEGLQ